MWQDQQSVSYHVLLSHQLSHFILAYINKLILVVSSLSTRLNFNMTSTPFNAVSLPVRPIRMILCIVRLSRSAVASATMRTSLLACVVAPLVAAQPFEEYMTTLSGTGQKGSAVGVENQELSYGNVLPETLLPWAMNGWAPVTDIAAGSWWFSSFDHHFYGIRCTHQPSPCESYRPHSTTTVLLRDLLPSRAWRLRAIPHRVSHCRYVAGQCRASCRTATTSLSRPLLDPAHQGATAFATYNPASPSTTFAPYLFQTTLLSYGTRAAYATVAVVPTTHGAVMRFTFPPVDTRVPAANGYNQTRRILLALDRPGVDSLALGSEASTGLLTLNGAATSNGGGVPANFAHYFYATVAGGGGAGVTPITPMSSGLLRNVSSSRADFKL